MKKIFIIIGLFLVLGVFFSCTEKSDRQSLISLMDQYLEALAQHDTTRVPLASI